MPPSTASQRPPVVLVTACNRALGDHPFHMAGRKYVDAARLAGAIPLIAPPVPPDQLGHLLDLVDGVLLTGSKSNVHPQHYCQTVHDTTLPLDPDRDAWTLPLVRMALQRGLPLLAICRGAQEANVALGGTLHQAVQEVAGLQDHRSRDEHTTAVQYGPAHTVQVQPGGVLQQALGAGHSSFSVNSLHGQGVARLAQGLQIEALAPDGVVEAFSMPGKFPDGAGFNLCVQWHPEWQAASNVESMQILRAFGAALVAWRDRVRGPLPGAVAAP
jgi:putative glutamine amidotransferase